MTAVVVVARLFPKQGCTRSMLQAIAPVAPDIHAEAGCEYYALHEADDGTIVIVEKWSSQEALDAHLIGEPVRAAREARAPFQEKPPTMETITPIPLGDPVRGAL